MMKISIPLTLCACLMLSACASVAAPGSYFKPSTATAKITAEERATFPAETGFSGAFRVADNDNPFFIAFEPDSAGNIMVWKTDASFWNTDRKVINMAGIPRPNAVDFNYNGYSATATYNPRNDTIRLAVNRSSTEYERASYAEFYAYREFLAK